MFCRKKLEKEPDSLKPVLINSGLVWCNNTKHLNNAKEYFHRAKIIFEPE